jgi:hypothetical protein
MEVTLPPLFGNTLRGESFVQGLVPGGRPPGGRTVPVDGGVEVEVVVGRGSFQPAVLVGKGNGVVVVVVGVGVVVVAGGGVVATGCGVVAAGVAVLAAVGGGAAGGAGGGWFAGWRGPDSITQADKTSALPAAMRASFLNVNFIFRLQ